MAPTGAATNIPIITTNGADPSPGDGPKRPPPLNLTDSDTAPSTPPDVTPPEPANGENLGHKRTKSLQRLLSPQRAGSRGGYRHLHPSQIVSATGFPPAARHLRDEVTQVKDGKSRTVSKTKHHKSPAGTVKFDETFKICCTPDCRFKIEAKEQHTFSHDEELGSALYFVDESNSDQEKEVKIGDGAVIIKSSFHPTENTLGTTESPKSSGLRRSFLRQERRRVTSRETTPVA